MEHKRSTKGMILDISSMRSRAIRLLDKKNDYNDLLEALTNVDYYNDDIGLPSVKELSEKTRIDYNKIRKQIRSIYDDLCNGDLDQEIPFEFKEMEIQFSLQGIYQSQYFSTSYLSVIPRIGDTIEVPFFKELIGTSYFHVANITHRFSDQKQEIFIQLETGSYNSYWKLRKDRALMTREISLQDYFIKNDYELQELIELHPGKAW